jgi:hypothetical protein
VKTFRPYAPEQAFLLPQSPHEWLPADHLARFLLDLVPALDPGAIDAHYRHHARKSPDHLEPVACSLKPVAWLLPVRATAS